jgi:hypothetical protein
LIVVVLAAYLAGTSTACQTITGCDDLIRCVSSQAEADRLNGTSSCKKYGYCPSPDGGDAGGDREVASDAAWDSEGIDGSMVDDAANPSACPPSTPSNPIPIAQHSVCAVPGTLCHYPATQCVCVAVDAAAYEWQCTHIIQ